MGDEPESILELLSLRGLGQASFSRKHEPNMRRVLELAMRNARTSPGPAMDPILLPDNATRVEVPGYLPDKRHVWKVNTSTLRILQATNLNDDAPSVEALQKLHEELVQDDEEHLLARPYRVWSPTLDTIETRLVGSFLDPELECPQFLAVEGARVLLRQCPTIAAPIDCDI
ncbi:hypothetical protein B0H17DRAFT_1212227 [Mycena rosella]|uniref:Uncharacterized protein n=1 Tax=Mycena rosella TaxID=1033263 RepID=A0AAD7G6U7_MYCRO|nr:hypothetical protein B0H17DRAFT_1212227 [Mycena rosella]